MSILLYIFIITSLKNFNIFFIYNKETEKMTDTYVSLNTAISLKENGFREICNKVYLKEYPCDDNHYIYTTILSDTEGCNDSSHENHNPCFVATAPTFHEVSEWIQRKYNICLNVIEVSGGYDFEIIRKYKRDNSTLMEYFRRLYPSYEICFNNAIIEILRFYIARPADMICCGYCDNYLEGQCTNTGMKVDFNEICGFYKRVVLPQNY